MFLHVVPDAGLALAHVASKLRPGATFLLYAMYAFDNRPRWFRSLWRLSNPVRVVISRLPHPLRRLLADVLAATVYLPLVTLAEILDRCGLDVEHFPLAGYRHRGFYVMRNDALDRFSTSIERRYSADEQREVLGEAGMTDVEFSQQEPFWCVAARRASDRAG